MTIFSFRNRFVFVANTRAASSAVHHLLLAQSDVIFYRPEFGKHLTFLQTSRCAQRMSGYSMERLFTFGIVREPVSWLYSWYRFRKREALRNPQHANHANYIPERVSFAQFCEEVCGARTRAFAQIPPQSSYFRDQRGGIGVQFMAVFENLAVDAHLLGAYPPLSSLSALKSFRLNSSKSDAAADVAAIRADQTPSVSKAFEADTDLHARALRGEFRKVPETTASADCSVNLREREIRENVISRIVLHETLGEYDTARRLTLELDTQGQHDQQVQSVIKRMSNRRPEARQISS